MMMSRRKVQPYTPFFFLWGVKYEYLISTFGITDKEGGGLHLFPWLPGVPIVPTLFKFPLKFVDFRNVVALSIETSEGKRTNTVELYTSR